MSDDRIDIELEARLRRAAQEAAPFDLTRFVARALDEGLVDVAWARVDSPIGPLWVAGTDLGLLSVGFGDPDGGLDVIATRISPRILEAPGRLDEVRRELDEYFEGRRRHFDLPLDRRMSKGFRSEVLRVLERVDFGQTVSYLDLAERVGSPRAARAVGTAMATNPIPIVVPCHRVLRTGGHLGGYGGGLDAKRWLLTHEGVEPPRR
ncbi:methylated-DNA--[protein]-cysteine S-methyltransferase [Actinomarinicola tropica]|uniref:Methylated-DNA--protein-cysteine methyltransferase n=1 Tax=Actinomarinicola tropica TaxID=2789776 RepID=A0A5Q2RLN2_9ACTN|nr:methylated-DNA--[protein]-cysteine S-methyltransferase [Actinomarinicola tropica]QGG95491.1 methylated-DNA--[protein]-cysteine S-methyltransferase [Actinomarinicola tropica]